jgi:hypothetical protein
LDSLFLLPIPNSPRVQTALQVYAKNYKQVVLDNSYGLLRKARRLDLIMAGHSEKTTRTTDFPTCDMRCFKCHTEYSPFFHAVNVKKKSESHEQAYECHICFSNKTAQQPLEQPRSTPADVSGTIMVGA